MTSTFNESVYGDHYSATMSTNQTFLHETSSRVPNNSVIEETINTSIDQSRDPLISFTVPAIMFSTGVIGNILAIVVLARQQKRTVFYRLVGALACTDLFGTCATSPVTLVVYANNLKWTGGVPLCNYISFMLIFATCSTMYLICAMAIDRYMSICRPFLYERYVSKGKVKYVLIGIWTFAAVMGCMPILGFGENVLQFPGTWCFFTFTSGVLKNQIFAFLFVSIGLLSIAGTVATNTFVIIDLIKIRRKTKREAICNACTYRHSIEIQMMVLMIGIMVIFTTCWCPFLIRIIVNQVNERQVSMKTDLLALRLASLNQILDPWIYILFRKEIFSRFKDVVRTLILYCGQHYKLSDRTDNNNKISSEITSNNIGLVSMKNNVDDNDVSANNISSTSGRSTSGRRMSIREAWQSTHLRHEEKSTLRQMMTQHKPACFGLYHPASIYCFSSLPHTFAMTLGINGKEACHTIQEVETFLNESEQL